MQLLANNARAKLSVNLLVGDTSLTVEAGKADSFPIGDTANWLAPDDWFKATLEDNLGNIEIVHVGIRGAGSGVLSNVLRGQDGTTARAFTAGSTVVEVRYTKADAEAGVNAILTSLQKTGGTMTGALVLAGDAVAPLQPATLQQLQGVETDAASDLAAAVAALTTAINNAQTAASANNVPTAAVQYFARATAPTGWVKGNGNTIGNAASGGTLRANADTQALFYALYADFTNAVLPIQDSAGVLSVRTTAAADYAANKRLPVPDLRGNFIRALDDGRGVDAARVLGSTQLDQMQGHIHQLSIALYSASTGGVGTGDGGANPTSIGNPINDGVNGVPRTGSETRPRNIALLGCIKL